MGEWMEYSGNGQRTLVIFPQVAEAIAAYYLAKGVPNVKVEELKFGLDEVMQIVNSLGARLLTGDQANIHGFLEILKEPWDIIWIISHGVPEGWFLNDGIVNTSETTAFVRHAQTFLLVLNSCESFEVANTIAEELEIALLCTIAQVPDRTAFITGVLFARNLASGLDYVEAWSRAKPGQKHPYVLIEARRPMGNNPNERRNFTRARGELPDVETLTRFFGSVEELERIVYGSPRLGLAPLRELTVQLQRDIAEIKNTELAGIKSQLTIIQRTQQQRNIQFLVMAVIIAILMAVIAVQLYAPGGGV